MSKELEVRLQRVEDHLACLQLRTDWEWAIDIIQSAPVYDPDAPGQDPVAAEMDYLMDLYTDDATMELYVSNGPVIMDGKKQIREYFRGDRSAVRFVHVLSNPWVQFDKDDLAYVRWYTTMFTGDAFRAIAETRDVYRKVNGVWKIRRIAAYPRISSGGGHTWQANWPNFMPNLPSLTEQEFFAGAGKTTRPPR
jgi:ketosteroid isomerase-like protein